MGRYVEQRKMEDASRYVVLASLQWVTKPMLMRLCRENGLPIRGTKAVLSERIWNHFNACQNKVEINHDDGSVTITVRAWNSA